MIQSNANQWTFICSAYDVDDMTALDSTKRSAVYLEMLYYLRSNGEITVKHHRNVGDDDEADGVGREGV